MTFYKMEENSMWLFEKDNRHFFSEGEIITEMLLTRKKQWTEQSSCYLKRHLELSPRCCLKSFTIFVGKFTNILGSRQVIWCEIFLLNAFTNLLQHAVCMHIIQYWKFIYNLFVTSKKKTTNSPVQCKVLENVFWLWNKNS